MRRRRRLLGVRGRTALTFALGAVLVSAVLAGSTYVIARQYLLGGRERAAVRQAGVDARIVRDGLQTSGTSVKDVLGRVAAPSAVSALVHRGGQWYSSSLDVTPEQLPPAVAGMSAAPGPATTMWTRIGGEPALVVSVPLPEVSAVLHEVSHLEELQSTLDTLRGVLLVAALCTGLAGAVLGRWAAGRAVRPLDQVAGAATRIAAGDLDTRLAATDDRDLAAIVGSFNDMVDALQARIDREVRFTADVAHELRSPLTTLVAAVDVVRGRTDELPRRSRAAVALAAVELERFRRLLEDLLELARLDAGTAAGSRELVDLRELVPAALAGSGRRPELVRHGPAPVLVRGDKRQLERAVVNLVENADRHGRGLVAVTVEASRGAAILSVDDAGPGVDPGDRERIFERFARGRGARGGQPGTGLGLSIVAETARAHGGGVWCANAPTGGARFVVRLPLAMPSDPIPAVPEGAPAEAAP